MPYEDIYDRLLGGRYRVLRELGEGAFGEVFEAVQTGFGLGHVKLRKVALKLFSREYVNEENADEVFREAIMVEELAANARSRGVPVHLVSVFDIGIFRDYHAIPFVAMELVPSTLEAELRKAPPLPLAAVIRHARGICAGLRLAHESFPQKIHRDLKPENVLIESNGFLKIADFGLVIDRHRAFVSHGEAGTICYSPPEVRHGGVATPAFDIYSIGVMMLEMLAKKNPLRAAVENLGDDRSRMEAQLDRAQDLLAQLRDPETETPLTRQFVELRASVPMQKILLRCLATDPVRRYRNAAELDEQLARCEAGESPSDEAGPISVEDLIQQARNARSEGRLHEAETCIAELGRHRAKDPAYFFELSLLRERQGRMEEALRNHREGLEIGAVEDGQTRLIALYKQAARQLRKEGRLAEAESLLNEFHQLAPRDLDYAIELSEIRKVQKGIQDAIDVLKEAGSFSSSRRYWQQLASLYREAGRDTEARLASGKAEKLV